MSSLNGVGERRVYPKMVTNRQLGTKEFIEKMRSHNHAISESVVTAVLTDVADYLGEMLAMGYTTNVVARMPLLCYFPVRYFAVPLHRQSEQTQVGRYLYK